MQPDPDPRPNAADSSPTASRPPLRVLHVFKTYFPDTQGGIEEAVRQICTATRALGVESTVLTVTRSREGRLLHRPEARVVRFPLTFEAASCPVSLRALPAFRAELARVDLVHYQFPWPYADVLDLLRPRAMPCVITYQSDVVRQRRLLPFYRPLMRHFLARADRIVATSPQYVASSPVLAPFRDKVEVIPMPLDPATYPTPHPQRVAHWRERLGDAFFLFIGVLRYYKGVSVLLDALRGTELRLAIVGSGPLEAALRTQAAGLTGATVDFLGSVSDADKVALLSLCRAVVLPSNLRSEAFGMSLLEGAMFGKALISCDIATGTSYVNADGETGLVVPPDDPPALRDALERLAGDSALSGQMGDAARHRFETLFASAIIGQRYRDLYDRVLGGR